MTETALARMPATVDAPSLVLVTTGPLDRHPAAVYLARLAPSSRRVMRAILDTLAGLLTHGQADALSCDWAALRYPHTAALRAHLAEHASPRTRQPYAPATANRALSALRGVLRQCWKLGYVDAETYQQAADLEPIRGSRLPRGRALKRGEVRALFEACAADGSALGVRDTAILAVQYGAGLRRAEVVALDLADLDHDTGALRVRGKGNKERLAYVPQGGRLALDEWLALRGEEPGPLFWPIGKTGVARPGRLSCQAILYVARRRSRAARVATFSPHDLRRSFISDLLEAGADLSTVADLAGHAQLETTRRYDRRGEAAKQRAATLVHVPYDGRRRGGITSRKEVDPAANPSS